MRASSVWRPAIYCRPVLGERGRCARACSDVLHACGESLEVYRSVPVGVCVLKSRSLSTWGTCARGCGEEDRDRRLRRVREDGEDRGAQAKIVFARRQREHEGRGRGERLFTLVEHRHEKIEIVLTLNPKGFQNSVNTQKLMLLLCEFVFISFIAGYLTRKKKTFFLSRERESSKTLRSSVRLSHPRGSRRGNEDRKEAARDEVASLAGTSTLITRLCQKGKNCQVYVHLNNRYPLSSQSRLIFLLHL